MKHLLKYAILFVIYISLSACNSDSKQGNNTADLSFKIDQGVNISHWLSQTNIRGEERAQYMTEKDFKLIASMGFDHVRLPIDEEQMWDVDGNKHEDAFALLHDAIKWSIENELKIIVDLHVIRSHHFNSKSNTLWTDPNEQNKFWNFWDELSDELKQYPNHLLAYELMNEAVAKDPEDWNKLIAGGIKLVREKEPNRCIIVGSNLWQQVYTFPSLTVPEGDTNIILSFHFYEPFLLTHYKTTWNPIGKYEGEVHYPGYSVDTVVLGKIEEPMKGEMLSQNDNFTKALLEEHIMIAKKVADHHELPLYCGEFGAFPSTDIETRVQLYRDLRSIFKKHNIAWAHWNYKNDFPLVDEETLEPIQVLVDELIEK